MTAEVNAQPVLRNEFAKFRHLHLGAVAGALILGVVGLTIIGMVSGISGVEPAKITWVLPLAGLGLAFPIVSPLLLAVLASRAVEIEHQGNGWMLNAVTGVGRGRLSRAKLVGTGAIAAAATVVSSIFGLGAGALLGAADAPPVWLWTGYTISVMIINLVVLAVQVLISARVDNQLVGLGIGVLGTVVALSASGLPRALAHMTPWGYYSLVEPANYQGGDAVFLAPSYASVAGLAVVAIVGFLWLTARLDRKEVTV